MNIDQSAMCCISMDSSREVLETNVKLFFQLGNHFRIIGRKQKYSKVY